MKPQRCEMCGKLVLRLHDHHIIPWYLSHDDSESNIMRLCMSCHRKADAAFNSLILYGEMSIGKSSSRRARRSYCKKYQKRKSLYHIKLMERTHYYDVLDYNIKTDNIRIMSWWRHVPSMHISLNANSRKRLVKAASLKGQTILSGGVVA